MKQQFFLKLRVHWGKLNTQKSRFANYGEKCQHLKTISSKNVISNSGKLSRLGWKELMKPCFPPQISCLKRLLQQLVSRIGGPQRPKGLCLSIWTCYPWKLPNGLAWTEFAGLVSWRLTNTSSNWKYTLQTRFYKGAYWSEISFTKSSGQTLLAQGLSHPYPQHPSLLIILFISHQINHFKVKNSEAFSTFTVLSSRNFI